MYARKKKSFGDEESRTKLEEKENVKTYRKCKKKNMINMSLFIVKVL